MNSFVPIFVLFIFLLTSRMIYMYNMHIITAGLQ
jgi:hypothetical protein